MRWKYPDAHDRQECVAREAVVGRMKRWWDEFARRAEDIDLYYRKGKDFDIPAFMGDNLQSIDGRIMWEFGPGPGGSGHRLVMTPESNFHLRPMVEHLVGLAPKLDGWSFGRYRPREGMTWAGDAVQAKTGRSLKDAQASCRVGSNACVDVTIHFPNAADAEDDLRSAAFYAVESLLGEESLDLWVGSVDVAFLPKRNWLASKLGLKPKAMERLIPLADLGSFFDGVVETVIDQAREPAWKPDMNDEGKETYTLLKINHGKSRSGEGQSDLIMANSAIKSIVMAQHSDAPFFSCRFSRGPVVYCYLKIASSEARPGTQVDFRTQYEDPLGEELSRTGAGGVIGGGSGTQFTYIELAVVNVPAFIPQVREKMRRLEVPKCSWLLFHDEYLSCEWVGIWDDTPPPPADEYGRVSGCFKHVS